jgi:hypothetical protein
MGYLKLSEKYKKNRSIAEAVFKREKFNLA